MAIFNLEESIKRGVDKALNEPIVNGLSVLDWAKIGMNGPRWISVKDRLPEKNGDYLIYNTDGIVWPYWYDEEYKEWYDSSGYLTESVTHWMPLPEAPKERDENDATDRR